MNCYSCIYLISDFSNPCGFACDHPQIFAPSGVPESRICEFYKESSGKTFREVCDENKIQSLRDYAKEMLGDGFTEELFQEFLKREAPK